MLAVKYNHNLTRVTAHRLYLNAAAASEQISLLTPSLECSLTIVSQYRKHAFMLMKPSETGDNEKSFGEPGYYESKIGSWTNIFAALKHISDNWTDCSEQLKQWAALVLIYDAMHFIQQELKRLESRMSCQLWLIFRNKMFNDMSKAQKAVLGHCFNLDPFVDIMSFLIRKISPKMTFLKDTSTDYQVFTRPRTTKDLNAAAASEQVSLLTPSLECSLTIVSQSQV